MVFHDLKNYVSHLLMEVFGKFNLKISVTPKWLERYMSFTINNKLSFMESFQLLSSALDSLVNNLNRDDFKCLSQEIENNVLDLVKHKGFYPYE